MFASLEGPCVLAVDAPWGYGKTTFIQLWSQDLQNRGAHVIEFNAWESDFTGSPFVSLLTELKRAIKIPNKNETGENILSDSYDKLVEIGKKITEVEVYFNCPGLANIVSIRAKFKLQKDITQKYEEYLSCKEEFHKELTNFSRDLRNHSKKLSPDTPQYPLVIMIDELDRCRPDYAVQFLEVAKHFFSADYVVFVLAINSSQLIHSIKAIYGQDFDAREYLRRFFDIDFKLPYQKSGKFIEKLLGKENIERYFDSKKISEMNRTGLDLIHIKNILKSFFGASDLSLRQISHSIHRLGFIFASLRDNEEPFIITVIVALIFRTFEAELYHKFYQGKISDAQVINVISSHSVVQDIQDKKEWHTFVAILILSYCEIKHAPLSDDLSNYSNYSPLMMQYTSPVTNDKTSDENTRARKILEEVKKLLNQAKSHKKKSPNYSLKKFIGFRESVDRIEMLSGGLKKD